MMIYAGLMLAFWVVSLFSTETFFLHWEARTVITAALLPLFGRCIGWW